MLLDGIRIAETHDKVTERALNILQSIGVAIPQAAVTNAAATAIHLSLDVLQGNTDIINAYGRLDTATFRQMLINVLEDGDMINGMVSSVDESSTQTFHDLQT